MIPITYSDSGIIDHDRGNRMPALICFHIPDDAHAIRQVNYHGLKAWLPASSPTLAPPLGGVVALTLQALRDVPSLRLEC